MTAVSSNLKQYLLLTVSYALRIGPRLCIVCLAILSLVPGQFRPHTGLPGQAEHFIAYFLTALLLAIQPRESLGKRTLVAAGLCAYAGILETLQIWVPGRSAQAVDFAASSGGAIGGAVVAAILLSLLAFFAKRVAAASRFRDPYNSLRQA